MVNLKAERLRAAREKAGFETAVDAVRAFGWKESAYRHHENGTRGFGPDAAKRYGRAFKVKPGGLLGLDRVDDGPPPEPAVEGVLIVNGSVAAGVWRESEYWDDDRGFEIEGVPAFPKSVRRFGLVVEGRSMDDAYEPGTVLDCLSIFDGEATPVSGDHVIVQRIRPDGLRELTVKEYLVEDGRYFLVPRSSRPEFQARIEIGSPSREVQNDETTEVIAFVVGSYPPRALDVLRRMGLLKRRT